MIDYEKKYVVNIDFPTFRTQGGHRIHINPYYVTLPLREKILCHYDPERYKISNDGGSVYLERSEAMNCIKGKKMLQWQGKNVIEFRACILCAKLPQWDI